MEILNFDTLSAEPTRLQFTVGGRNYLLREATGDAVVKWRNAVIKASRLAKEGNTLLAGEGLADTELLLVSLASRMLDPADGSVVTKDGKEVVVPVDTVRGWGYPIVQTLFDRAKQYARLQEFETIQTIENRIIELNRILVQRRKDEESEKNSSSSGNRGSE